MLPCGASYYQFPAAETIEKEITAQTQEFPIMLRGGRRSSVWFNRFGYGDSHGTVMSTITGDEYGDELQQGRRLWGISWSNLCIVLAASVETKRGTTSVLTVLYDACILTLQANSQHLIHSLSTPYECAIRR
jgi:hypothetical protein